MGQNINVINKNTTVLVASEEVPQKINAEKTYVCVHVLSLEC
jgi:hypothetical protein